MIAVRFLGQGQPKPWALQCSLIVRSICYEDTVKESVERTGNIFTSTQLNGMWGRRNAYDPINDLDRYILDLGR